MALKSIFQYEVYFVRISISNTFETQQNGYFKGFMLSFLLESFKYKRNEKDWYNGLGYLLLNLMILSVLIFHVNFKILKHPDDFNWLCIAV